MKKYIVVLAILLTPMLWVGASSAGEENLNGTWDFYFMFSPGSVGHDPAATISGGVLTVGGVSGAVTDADPFVVWVITTGCAPVYIGWSLTDVRMGGNGICTDGSLSEVAWMAAKLGTEDASASGEGTADSP